ncbi:ABC transporter permease [Actinomadura sp. DC4]|uniref:ABC transporter permease n=1 Tax=Actinomadura sp. DC4 TaxID=3055069 RepID=UPI0025B172BA|nr:ABC transporter permease [Actinomadura sp. DC4]MDN3355360.1 ABC transporter permease [Actinomadura sp. DC4]
MWIAPERRRAHRWIAPVFAVAAGVAVGAAVALRGQTETGVVTAAVLLAYGILLGARGNESQGSETFGGTGGRGGAHQRAAAVTADVLVAVIVAALIIQALRGAEIWVLAGLAAIACVTYLVSILSISWY